MALAALVFESTAQAQGHSAFRSFSTSEVEPGGWLEVSIVVEGYGAIGQVIETLPDGFTYRGSDMPRHAVSVEGRTVAFTLFQSSSFTYVVTAPAAEGRYAFSGTVKYQARQERPVAGSSSGRVGAPPTPEPTVAPAAEPAVAPTAMPEPTVPPRPAGTAAPTETPPPLPTTAPALAPSLVPAPALAGTPTPVSMATPKAASTMRPTPTRRPTATR